MGTPPYPNDSGAALDALGIDANSLLIVQRPSVPGTQSYAYGTGEAVAYGTFLPRNADYLGKTWARCRAFYKGGKDLLDNDTVMADVFPKHLAERPDVYRERKRRAFYLNYSGAIVDWFVAALASDPVTLGVPQDDDDPSSLELPDEQWDEFFEDVSKPGGERCSFHEHMLCQLRCALQTRRVWTLVDFPELSADGQLPATLAEQDRAGGRRAYLVHVDPEEVIDWEADESGELLWAIRRTVDCPREDWRRGRSQMVETFTIYDRTTWTRFQIRYPRAEKPDENAKVFKVAEGVHSFPRVPLLPLVLPDGLWAMGKLESPVRAHFNKRNALDWAEHKSLLPVLYEFLAPEMPIGGDVTDNSGANDPSRSVSQVRGTGYVQERQEKDRAEFIGPDSSPFAAALESCRDLRDELHRIVHQMALAVNNTGASIARSAESKGQDKADRTTIIEELGRRLREYALRIIETVEAGMGESPSDWHARGWESFDLASLGELIDQAVQLSVLNIPSRTFKKLHSLDIIQKTLGEKATPEVMETCAKELDGQLEQDDLVKTTMAERLIDEPATETEEPAPESDQREAPAPPTPAGRQRVFSSKR